ncbi:[heparan sulfate]-glucosamine 3-sulfotransferase-like protein [Fragilaria crotonensis]|nr:[heparan sulfate]-glucosamine 3-sulfotransferase-like protein [Fragilaria crotonensis]
MTVPISRNSHRLVQLAMLGVPIFVLSMLTMSSLSSNTNLYERDSINGPPIPMVEDEAKHPWKDDSPILVGTDRTKQIAPRSQDRNSIGNQPNSPTVKLWKGKSFVDRHCHLGDGTDDDILREWWPEGDWKTRTPYFLLIGAKKGGTTALTSWLYGHPMIVRPRSKELHSFLPTHETSYDNYDNVTQKYMVHQIRTDIYVEDYNVAELQANESAISFEATPGYLLFSTLSRIPILCTMPWVKLLVTLRSPIDRSFSNYNFLLDYRVKRAKREGLTNMAPFRTLEEFLDDDIQMLKQAGVLQDLQDDVARKEFYGSEEERHAWTTYQSLVGRSEAPVGRSLYILQLQEWFSALEEIGRDPLSEVLVVRNEDMKRTPDDVFQQVLRWLGLPSFTPPNYTSRMVTRYHSGPMSNETYAMLEELYRPYNERLFALLGWDADVWDNSHFLEKQAELSKDADVSQDDETSSIELEHIYEPPYFDEVKGQKFTDQWCVLDNVSWYPEGNELWQLRAPYFILPGAKKSGTTSVASYLMQHPLVERARTKELQFFLSKNFLPDYLSDDNKTLVREAREHLYTTDYHSNVLSRNNSLMSFDGTPGYLFDGVNMVRRILCVSPWVKLVIVLRNPVDRAFSNWAFAMWRNKVKNVIPFETYMDQDMRALKTSGVLTPRLPRKRMQRGQFIGHIESKARSVDRSMKSKFVNGFRVLRTLVEIQGHRSTLFDLTI